jgi:hypothetical protein
MCHFHSTGHRTMFARLIKDVSCSVLEIINEFEKEFPLQQLWDFSAQQKLKLGHLCFETYSCLGAIRETVENGVIDLGGVGYPIMENVDCPGNKLFSYFLLIGV